MARHIGLVLAGISLAVTLLVPQAEAQGPLRLAPTEGPLLTTIELSSVAWIPNTPVNVMAAASSTMASPAASSFVGPVATTRSDAAGHWAVHLQVQSSEDLHLPETGFVFYRAESPGWSPEGILPIVGFTLATDAERPNGAGGFDLSITSSENSGILLFAWRIPSEDAFSTPYGQITLPFNTTIQGLTGGEYELAFLSTAGLEPVSGGPFENVSAPLCLTVTTDCNVAPTSLWVKRVTVENGQLTDVDIGLVPPEGGGSSNQAVRVGLPAGGAALALSIGAVGFVIMRRREHLR